MKQPVESLLGVVGVIVLSQPDADYLGFSLVESFALEDFVELLGDDDEFDSQGIEIESCIVEPLAWVAPLLDRRPLT